MKRESYSENRRELKMESLYVDKLVHRFERTSRKGGREGGGRLDEIGKRRLKGREVSRRPGASGAISRVCFARGSQYWKGAGHRDAGSPLLLSPPPPNVAPGPNPGPMRPAMHI